MATTYYRFATTADAQRELEAAWQRHQTRLVAGVDFLESRKAFRLEYEAITPAAVDPAGQYVVLDPAGRDVVIGHG